MYRNMILPGIVVFTLTSLCSAAPVVFHVSPRGEDGNAGTEEQPFATLVRARDAIRALKRERKLSAEGAEVRVVAGYYRLADSIVFTAEDSGTAAAPIVYRGLGEATLGGGVVVTAERLQDGKVLERLDAAARPHMFVVDLKDAGIRDYGRLTPRGFGRPSHPSPVELYSGMTRLQIARWPNEGWATIADAKDRDGADRFAYAGDRPARWKDARDLWLHGYWKHDWADSYVKVARIDADGRQIITESPHGVYGYTKGKRWRALNVLEEIDQWGEYVIDREKGVAYVYLTSPPRGRAQLHAATLDKTFVIFQNASHIRFDSFTIQHGRSHGIEVRGGEDVQIRGCTIEHLGQGGISIQGGVRHRVQSCDLRELGEHGIAMDGGDRMNLTPGGHEAVNNHIHHFGYWCRTYRPGLRLSGVGLVARNNLIHHAPHAAILFGGNEHLIELNRIHNVAQECGDVGVIYTGRDWTARGTVIRHNFLHDTVSRMSHGTMGVYLDDCASGISIVGNVFLRAGRAAFIGGGRDNLVEGNLFVDCEHAVHIDNRGQGWAKGRIDARDGGSWDLFGKLKRVRHDQPPYSKRYPALARILDEQPHAPRGNTVRGNVVVGQFLHLSRGVRELVTFENNITDAKPQFRDVKRYDLRLPADSALYGKGFEPIPFERIGLELDAWRKRTPDGLEHER